MASEQSAASTPRYAPWNIGAGLAFALCALVAVPLVGIDVSTIFSNDDGQVTWLTLFIGVFAVGCFIWWRLVSRTHKFTLWRGAVAGTYVAVFSYPVVIALAEIFQRNWQEAGEPGTIAERLQHILLLSGLTLLTTGFAAIILMAVIGAAIAWTQGRRFPQAAALGKEQRRRRGFIRTLLRVTGTVAVVLLIALAGTFSIASIWPLDTKPLTFDPASSHPAADYPAALAAFDAVKAREAQLALHPRCHSSLLTHGSKVKRAVIFFHGLTNCPAQIDVLGQQLFDQGYNVYIPRLPGHGMADPMTTALADLTAEQLVATTNESIDLAQGLGDEVVVAGLSAGGTMVAWSGQYRADAGNTVSIAPFFSPHVVPPWAAHAAASLMLAAPNIMVWWNPLEPFPSEEMDYAYPRYATHAVAQIMRLGQAIDDSARREAAKAQNLGLLVNDADTAVSNAFIRRVADAWRAEGRQVDVENLPEARQLPHDLIDPRQADQDIAFVYPIVLQMIAGQPPPGN